MTFADRTAMQHLQNLLDSECATHERYILYLSQIRDVKIKRTVRFNMRCHKERIEILSYAVSALCESKSINSRESIRAPRVLTLKENEILRILALAETSTLKQYNSAMRTEQKSNALKCLFDRQKLSLRAIENLRRH